MIYYNFELILFSIILGTLTLIYNNDFDLLYKSTKYKSTILVTTNFRSLEELSHKPTTNHKYENIKLKKLGNTNEEKHKKNNYPKNDTKKKQNFPEVSENQNTATSNSKKYSKKKYDEQKEEKSNKSSLLIKYLELHRKLYSNCFVKKYMNFLNFSNKLNPKNDKSCECPNKKKSSDKLSLSNKVHDNYLDFFKERCAGYARMRGCYSVFFDNLTMIPGAAVFCFAQSTSGGISDPFGIAALVVTLIAVVIILLYIWLFRRRKNTLKDECKRLKNSWKRKFKKNIST